MKRIRERLWDLRDKLNASRAQDRLFLRLDRIQEALGRLEARQLGAGAPLEGLRAQEFRVYSQWGEDGILQHLVGRVPIARKLFVEFGVEDYTESNTRFLLENDNWGGLVLDGDAENIARIRASRTYWFRNLKAAQAFVTAENIGPLLAEHGLEGEIGLLSIDIDGNDFWVWRALDRVSPALVVVEYNHLFGPDAARTVPYDPAFERARAHPSCLFFGASLRALWLLGQRKGYDLVGCNSTGVNAFFVRKDLRPADLPALTAAEAFVPGQFCEARDASGAFVKMTRAEQVALVASLPSQDVEGLA